MNSQRKKVFHILTIISFSGAEVMLKDASKAFLENGLELHALNSHIELGEYASVLNDCGYKIHQIENNMSIRNGVKLFKILKREKVDIVHIHREGQFLWYAFVSKLSGVKSIIRHVHNVFPFENSWKDRRSKYLQRFIARKLLNIKFLAIGESVAEVERRIYKHDPIIIPNWIDTDKFKPAQYPQEKEELRKKFKVPLDASVLISVGRCTDVKNHKAILEAIFQLNNILDKRVLYLHLGNGIMHQEEKECAQKLDINDQVWFMGEVNNVRDLLIASDIFVMPSLYEGLGNSLLEAMSCGLPSVGYNVYGLKDLIKEDNGILVDCSVYSLAEGISKLVLDPELRKKMGERAIKNVENNYSRDQSVNKLINVYNSL